MITNTVPRIAWFSAQYDPTPEQLDELNRLYPGHQLIIDHNTWGSVDALARRFVELQANDMVVVLPLTVIRLLTQRGFCPLQAQMVEVRDGGKGLLDNTRKSDGVKRHYKFIKFRRIVSVDIKYAKVEPMALTAEAKRAKELTEEEQAWQHSSHHRKEIEESIRFGCFYCCNVLDTGRIVDWTDHGETALCPYCGIDSVLPESAGFPLMNGLLERMHERYF